MISNLLIGDVCTYVCTCMHACMYVRLGVCVCVCIHTCIHTHTHTQAHTHTHTRKHTRTNTHTQTYTHTHTHTHTSLHTSKLAALGGSPKCTATDLKIMHDQVALRASRTLSWGRPRQVCVRERERKRVCVRALARSRHHAQSSGSSLKPHSILGSPTAGVCA